MLILNFDSQMIICKYDILLKKSISRSRGQCLNVSHSVFLWSKYNFSINFWSINKTESYFITLENEVSFETKAIAMILFKDCIRSFFCLLVSAVENWLFSSVESFFLSRENIHQRGKSGFLGQGNTQTLWKSQKSHRCLEV